jgi:hypothetical protein
MEALIMANAPYEDTEPGVVYYEGSTEDTEKETGRAKPPEDDKEWIAEEMARMTRGQKPGSDRPKLLKQEDDDDEGEVFIG